MQLDIINDLNEMNESNTREIAEYERTHGKIVLPYVSVDVDKLNALTSEVDPLEIEQEVLFNINHQKLQPFFSPEARAKMLTIRCGELITESACKNASGCGLVDRQGKVVTNFDIVDIQILENVDGDREQSCDFNIVLDNAEKYHFNMTFEEFRRAAWGNSRHGMRCTDRKIFREYIDKICVDQTIQKVYTVPVPGWYEKYDGDLYFVGADSNTVGTTDKISVQDEGALIIKAPEIDKAVVAATFWKMILLTKSSNAIILMVYVVMAAMYTIFKKTVGVPKFLIVLTGLASTGKTSLALAICNLFQRDKRQEPELSIRSTFAGIEDRLGHYKDSVAVIDDLYPAETPHQKRELENTLERIVRMFGDGAARKKSIAWNDGKIFEPQGLALITGEYFTGGLSSQTRCLVLNMQSGDINWDLLTSFQHEFRMNLSYFIWNFVEYCHANINTKLAYLQAMIESARRRMLQEFDRPRTASIFAYMVVTHEILLDYLVSCGVVQANMQSDMQQEFEMELRRILLENEAAQKAREPLNQVLQVISQLINESPERLVDLAGEVYRSDYYHDDRYIYAYPQTLLLDIKKETASMGIPTSIDTDAQLKRCLEEQGILVPYREGERVRKAGKISKAQKIGDNRRFLRLSRKKIQEFANE